MALLNFANKYSTTYLYSEPAEGSKDPQDYHKLIFTKDGHIVTHGVDYIPWGTGKIPLTKIDTITTAYLPVDSTKTDTTHLWDSKTINDKINASFTANDAMRFKGTMGLVSGSTTSYTINGSEATFPSSSAVVGDTYRITSAGTYAGQKCEVGDLLICITAGSSSTAATWTVAQTNITGYTTNSVNGTTLQLYNNNSNSFSIYAPTTTGTSGQFLVSTGGTPTWKNLSDYQTTSVVSASNGLTVSSSTSGLKTTYTVKGIDASASSKGVVQIGSNITVSSGTISLSKANVIAALGYTPEGAGSNSWRAITVNGKDFLSNDTTTGALNLAGGSGIIVSSASGTATFNVNTGFTTSGKNYAVQVDSTSGGLYVAVPWENTQTWRNVKVNGTEQLSTATGTALDLVSGTGVSVTWDDTNKKVKFSVNTGYTTSGKNYKVQADSNSNLYVNVPWTDTTYSVVSSSANGLAPKVISSNTTTIGTGYYILASSNGSATPSWYKLPSTAFVNTNTWRPVKVGTTTLSNSTSTLEIVSGDTNTLSAALTTAGVLTLTSKWRGINIGGTSIGYKDLKISPTDDVYVSTNETDDVYEIGFGIGWYNMSSEKMEY